MCTSCVTGVPHTWWVGKSELNHTTVRIKLEPPGPLGEKAFESISGFTRDYGCMQVGAYPAVVTLKVVVTVCHLRGVWAAEYSWLVQGNGQENSC